MKKGIRILAGLIFGLILAANVYAQCPAGAVGCNLVCAVSFGFGNSTYCALVDDNGTVFDRVSFFPPCINEGCFPVAQTLLRTEDGNVGSLMLQGSRSGTYGFSLSKMTVNSELTYLSSQTVPKHPKMKIAGFPILQAVRGSESGQVFIAYMQRVSGSSAASSNAPQIAELTLVKFDQDRYLGTLMKILKVDENEFEILGGSSSDEDEEGYSLDILRLRNKKTGEIIDRFKSYRNGRALYEGFSDKPVAAPEPVENAPPPTFSFDSTPVENTAVMGLGAAPQRFDVIRMIVHPSPSLFQSQIYVRQIDPTTNKVSSVKTISPRSKTVQPAAEFNQSIAVDPNKRFVAYSFSDPKCSTALTVRFQKLNPATGTKIGPPKSLIGCGDLQTTITGLYGLDVMNLQ